PRTPRCTRFPYTTLFRSAGHQYRAALKPGASAPPALAAEAQAVIDAFLVENRWHRRQQELVLRQDRDGEAFLRFFTAGDGSTRIDRKSTRLNSSHSQISY